MKIYRTAQAPATKTFCQPQNVFSQNIFPIFYSATMTSGIKWLPEGNSYALRKINATDKAIIYYGMINTGAIHTPEFKMNIVLSGESITATLIFNKDQRKVCEWNGSDAEVKQCLMTLGLTMKTAQAEQTLDGLPSSIREGKTIYGYTRLTMIRRTINQAMAFEIWMEKAGIGHCSVHYITTFLEQQYSNPEQIVVDAKGNKTYPIDVGTQLFRTMIQSAMDNGYVDKRSVMYIPFGVNTTNWDFVLNNWLEGKKPMQKTAQAQNFGGYYSGNVPDYAANLVGTSSVDASQVASVFGNANDAIQMVNRFDGSLLRNIAFIFNFSKGGAYGVYLSELDRAIKTKVLEKQLTTRGYKVTMENGLLMAEPTKAEIPTDAVQKEIDRLYGQIDSTGGTAIGINVAKVIDAATQDANGIPSPDKNFLFGQLAVLHLGETIVHEAVHAKNSGTQGEGPSESAEANFVQWALPIINDNYKKHLVSMKMEDQYVPIVTSTNRRHAASVNWYKEAQSMYGPSGSDLHGRMNNSWMSTINEGRGGWGGMVNMFGAEPTEKKLGRQFMWPLARDINPDQDSIAVQLLKTNKRWVPERDYSQTMEEMLRKDHLDEHMQYQLTERSLDEKRPAPLLLPLKQASITKLATVFGWYNNLEISDGSSIPGLGDRVMSWDDRDDDFAMDDDWTRHQPRYNPEYDSKGIYYRWIEPRFQPTLFDDMTNDNTNTHPAKRFGSADASGSELKEILRVIGLAVDRIKAGKFKASRFIASSDLTDFICKAAQAVQVYVFDVKEDDDIQAIWLCANEVSDQKVAMAEKYFRGDDQALEIADELTGIVSYSNETAKNVFDAVKQSSVEKEIESVYLVGEAARMAVLHQPISTGQLNFVCDNKNDTLMVGQDVARILGEKFKYMPNDDLVIIYRDRKITFCCGTTDKKNRFFDMVKTECSAMMDDPVIMELLNRDFTINMIAWDVVKGCAYDPLQVADDIRSQRLATRFDPRLLCELNPQIAVHAVSYIHRGFEADERLINAVNTCLQQAKEGE